MRSSAASTIEPTEDDWENSLQDWGDDEDWEDVEETTPVDTQAIEHEESHAGDYKQTEKKDLPKASTIGRSLTHCLNPQVHQ